MSAASFAIQEKCEKTEIPSSFSKDRRPLSDQRGFLLTISMISLSYLTMPGHVQAHPTDQTVVDLKKSLDIKSFSDFYSMDNSYYICAIDSAGGMHLLDLKSKAAVPNYSKSCPKVGSDYSIINPTIRLGVADSNSHPTVPLGKASFAGAHQVMMIDENRSSKCPTSISSYFKVNDQNNLSHSFYIIEKLHKSRLFSRPRWCSERPIDNESFEQEYDAVPNAISLAIGDRQSVVEFTSDNYSSNIFQIIGFPDSVYIGGDFSIIPKTIFDQKLANRKFAPSMGEAKRRYMAVLAIISAR